MLATDNEHSLPGFDELLFILPPEFDWPSWHEFFLLPVYSSIGHCDTQTFPPRKDSNSRKREYHDTIHEWLETRRMQAQLPVTISLH